MFRDEGSEPSIQFKERMRARVERTPTSLIVAVMPFLVTARLAVIAHHTFVKSRSKALARRIDPYTDLREGRAPVPGHALAQIDRAA
jgi:hypothetical protein